MSTYYYLACNEHREMVPFWSRYAGGPSVLPTARDRPETVQRFIDAHERCGITVFSEHDDRALTYLDTLDEASTHGAS